MVLNFYERNMGTFAGQAPGPTSGLSAAAVASLLDRGTIAWVVQQGRAHLAQLEAQRKLFRQVCAGQEGAGRGRRGRKGPVDVGRGG